MEIILQYFTLVLFFSFQFSSLCNFRKFVNFGFGRSVVKGLNRAIPRAHQSLSFTCFHVAALTEEETLVSRQSYAGLLWSKQFYHYVIQDWLKGDPETPVPPTSRLTGRNSEAEWQQLFNKDVVSMPDKWEYPWVGLSCKSRYTLSQYSWSRDSPSFRRYCQTGQYQSRLRLCIVVLTLPHVYVFVGLVNRTIWKDYLVT